jgi:hypothetical protein
LLYQIILKPLKSVENEESYEWVNGGLKIEGKGREEMKCALKAFLMTDRRSTATVLSPFLNQGGHSMCP